MTPNVCYSSRSRALEFQRCPRSRYWLHEAQGTGYEPMRQSIPLATGSAAHALLAGLLRGHSPEDSIGAALASYEESCAKRGLKVAELEDQSLVYQEQRALVEGLGYLAALRVVPALLATYEVLEVEKMDEVALWQDNSQWLEWVNRKIDRDTPLEDIIKLPPERPCVIWRSIPDALLRHRESGNLYILSWKTAAQLPDDLDARTDMQGLSETWSLERRLGNGQTWETQRIRGVQMAYLLKGRKISAKEDARAEGAAGKSWRHNSPLIWGYRDQSFPPKLAWSREWRCSASHPMRKSKWYPTGECPGDGRNHRRGEDWTSFAVWEAMGVREWLGMLETGEVTPEAGSALDLCWNLPVPNFRPPDQIERWHRQIVRQERQVANQLAKVRIYEQAERDGEPEGFETRLQALDDLFPQHTEHWCSNTYGAKCPAWELCWGPESTARDPLASGLYQLRTPYHEPKESEAPE